MFDVARALRRWVRQTGADRIAELTDADHALLTDAIDVSAWYSYDQYLRLIDAAFKRSCNGDWQQLHALCAAGFARACERGYDRLLRRGDRVRAFAAVSVLWRASHDFGSAVAYTDPWGTTISVTHYPGVGELAGNVNAGWFLGVAQHIGVEVERVELRRRPWVGEGDEQVIRLHWREVDCDALDRDSRRDSDSNPCLAS